MDGIGDGDHGQGEFSIAKVLDGYQPGRELEGYKHKLAKATKAGQHTLIHELHTMIEVITAAKAWRMASIKAHAVPDLILY